MYTLREKIENVVYHPSISLHPSHGVDLIMQIIENHIEWTDPDECRFGHTFSDCGWYEIDSTNTVYYNDDMISARHTMEEAKQAAQAHKEGRG